MNERDQSDFDKEQIRSAQENVKNTQAKTQLIGSINGFLVIVALAVIAVAIPIVIHLWTAPWR